MDACACFVTVPKKDAGDYVAHAGCVCLLTNNKMLAAEQGNQSNIYTAAALSDWKLGWGVHVSHIMCFMGIGSRICSPTQHSNTALSLLSALLQAHDAREANSNSCHALKSGKSPSESTLAEGHMYSAHLYPHCHAYGL